jgi:hypothetical protein
MQDLHDIIASYENGNAEELLQACRELKQSLKDEPKISREQMETMSDDLGLTHAGAISIIKHNIFPAHHCKIGGFNIDAAFYAGYGVGFGLGHCLASNGRLWTVMVPTNSFHFGMGFTVVVTGYQFSLKRGSKSFDVDNGSLGLGLAIKSGEVVEGYGVGLGLMVGALRGRMLKLLPAGNNFEFGLNALGVKN